MNNILLAVEKDLMGNDIKIIYGSVPWKGLMEATIEDIESNKIELKNIRVSDKGEIINTRGNIKRYTTLSEDAIIKRSYVVLAKSENTGSSIYFMTDGLNNPVWVRSEDLQKKLLHEHIELANSRLIFSTNGTELETLEEPFEQVDYNQVQLEYRKYLKSIK